MSNDAELLREFVEQASEEAFAELVSRHLNLVFSAALRQVGGDRHLAQDVVQSVFTTFARKARSLPANVLLAGWLYRHTGFAARQAVRTECRRRRREQEAVAMNISDTTEPAWEQLAPVLDQAIQRLRVVERDALILRYFENRDLRSVADALGTSEEAAKKRVARAVQRLRVFFQRRGLTLSAATLLGLLTTKAVAAAPLGLNTTIATAACASASGGGSGLWVFQRTIKVAVVVAASLGLITLVGVFVAHSLSSSSGPMDVRVELTGSAGTKVTGYYVSDGTIHAFSGLVPTNIIVQARQFYYSIKKASEPGELRGDLYLNGQSWGASSTSAAGWGVAGRLAFKGPVRKTMVTCVSPTER